MILSGWYDGHVKPVHIGVYEILAFWNEPLYSFYDGKVWRTPAFRGGLLQAPLQPSPAIEQNRMWRGIVDHRTKERRQPHKRRKEDSYVPDRRKG